MSHNSFGKLFKVTTWGESHGTAIGCVIDGCPPMISLTEKDIQKYLDLRKPGTSKFVTQRKEDDEVEILSGVFEGQTTGTPIGLLIRNKDQRSKDYGDIAKQFRPGHADFTYQEKYGIRDYRGGGRSSARETAVRVAAGAIADVFLKQALGSAYRVRGGVVQIGPHKVNRENFDWDNCDKNPFFCPDAKAAEEWEGYLDAVRKAGSSAGAILEIVADGIPAGLGQPVYGKLDTELAAAMMSINAVKGVEIGGGFDLAAMDGRDAGDEMRAGPSFLSNNSGGILGGISSGQQLVVRIAIKPTSSILTNRQSIDEDGKEVELQTKGRHDPCVGIRGVPVAEAMMALTLADHLMRHHAQCGILPKG